VHYSKIDHRIAEMGQTRSFGDVGSMSGLPGSGHGWAIEQRCRPTRPTGLGMLEMELGPEFALGNSTRVSLIAVARPGPSLV
jgi:hypothetical protein